MGADLEDIAKTLRALEDVHRILIFAPRVIEEREGKYTIEIPVPGYKERDIKLSYDSEQKCLDLYLEGEEFSIDIPEVVNLKNIKANLKIGLIKVSFDINQEYEKHSTIPIDLRTTR